MNVILVPALLLLIGLVVWKKVVEPKRGQKKPEPTQQVAKPRMPSGTGRMGSVL